MLTKPKFLIPLAVSLFIAAFFTATQPLRPEMAIVSSIFVVLFALPSYYTVVSTKGNKKGFLVLVVLGFYALLIESSAINTGFPYGDFIYNDLLGEKVFGLTPWTVAFAWPPIILLAYWTARFCTRTVLLQKTLKTVLLTAIFATSIDVVLDPAAVSLGFWNWHTPGFFYGVPLVNFLGWLLSGFVGGGILHWLWRDEKTPQALAYSGIAVLWFWTWANVFLANVIPALVGFGLLWLFIRQLNK